MSCTELVDIPRASHGRRVALEAPSDITPPTNSPRSCILIRMSAQTQDLTTEPEHRLRFHSLQLKNFLSYKDAEIDFSKFIAIIGQNAAGKSNAVAALKLLRDIPEYGLSNAIHRRGGFDQLRHRSAGRPFDPALTLKFQFGDLPESEYYLSLGAVRGGQYRVKVERAQIHHPYGSYGLHSDGVDVSWSVALEGDNEGREFLFKTSPGQSAMSSTGIAGVLLSEVLQSIQTVEINPSRVADLQDPSSVRSFEPDGSNVTSIFDNMPKDSQRGVVDELEAMVPGIVSINVARLADKLTLKFKQETTSGNREFFAKQMSDGTLRGFAILVAASQQPPPRLLVIEEPEVAIHLGALRTLVDLLDSRADESQIMITTHSADIIDALPIDNVRIVWSNEDSSHIAPISEHSKDPVRRGLITSGALLRSDALDPAL